MAQTIVVGLLVAAAAGWIGWRIWRWASALLGRKRTGGCPGCGGCGGGAGMPEKRHTP